jgi:2-amino-4-hydroxy-6-hydroxymethyldihydropteridine diphosphokinase
MSRNRRAYVALGANLGDPPAQLQRALQGLRDTPDIVVAAVSRFYRTPPLGPPGQPDYCNAVCALDTSLTGEALLDVLQGLENAADRQRGERWGARTLDLDLLHVEGETMRGTRLTLPHPELHRRAFVLVPLAEIALQLVIPGLGRIGEMALAIDRTGIRLWQADLS